MAFIKLLKYLYLNACYVLQINLATQKAQFFDNKCECNRIITYFDIMPLNSFNSFSHDIIHCIISINCQDTY